MKNVLRLCEINKNIEISSQTLINNEIEITNTSSHYINNLKLIIQTNDFSIIKQSVTRQRGSLDFSPDTYCLELGNLAPEETAYFEYKFCSEKLLPSLSSHLILSYVLDNELAETKEKVSELLEKVCSIPID